MRRWEGTTSRVDPAVLLVTTFAAAASGLLLLRRQPLSWDESVTAAVATRSVPAMIGTLRHSDAVLGSYYLLAHGWSGLLTGAGLRVTEIWWRLPSALAAVATCGLVAAVAGRAGGRRAAVAAGCLLAVLPLFGFYAVDARPYTLAALAVTAAWSAWTRRAGPPGWRRVLLTAALLVVGAWLQLFTVLVWPAFVLVGGRRRWRPAVAAVGLALVGTAPLAVVAAGQTSEIGWIPPASWADVGRVALHVGGGVAVVATGGALVVAAVRAGLVRWDPATRAVLWWVAAPVCSLAAIDLVRPVLVARYALVSLPVAAVAFGVLVSRARAGTRQGATVRVLAVAAVVAAVVTSSWQGAQPWKYEDYRAASAFAASAVPRATPVLFATSSARLGFDRYAGAADLVDVALPAGVGSDPLLIRESSAALVRERLAGACTAVVVGNGTFRTAGGRAAGAAIAVRDWTVTRARSFGALDVTVVRDPTCETGPGERPPSTGDLDGVG